MIGRVIRSSTSASTAAAALALFAAPAALTRSFFSSSSEMALKMSSDDFYGLTPSDLAGNAFPFSDLKGKVVLITNVASY